MVGRRQRALAKHDIAPDNSNTSVRLSPCNRTAPAPTVGCQVSRGEVRLGAHVLVCWCWTADMAAECRWTASLWRAWQGRRAPIAAGYYFLQCAWPQRTSVGHHDQRLCFKFLCTDLHYVNEGPWFYALIFVKWTAVYHLLITGQTLAASRA